MTFPFPAMPGGGQNSGVYAVLFDPVSETWWVDGSESIGSLNRHSNAGYPACIPARIERIECRRGARIEGGCTTQGCAQHGRSGGPGVAFSLHPLAPICTRPTSPGAPLNKEDSAALHHYGVIASRWPCRNWASGPAVARSSRGGRRASTAEDGPHPTSEARAGIGTSPTRSGWKAVFPPLAYRPTLGP